MLEQTSPEHQQLKELSGFLIAYCTCLMGAGAQTSRIERNIDRIARRYDTEVCVSFFQKSLTMTLWDRPHNHSYTAVGHIQHRPLCFATNALLSRLSWRIHDRRLPLDTAWYIYRQVERRQRYNRWLVCLMVALANASFCRLFGGDAPSMTLVWVATWIGFSLKQWMQQWKWNEYAIFTACSFISSAFGSLGYLLAWGTTPDMALGTSVLYLIPGVPLINGTMDVIDGHSVTGNTRLFNASLLVVCIAVGLSLTLCILGIINI